MLTIRCEKLKVLVKRETYGRILLPQFCLLRYEGRHDVNREGEDDSRVVFGGDAAQGLEIAELLLGVSHQVISDDTMMTYCTWRAAGESAMTSAACLRALLALCSPSAAITWDTAGLNISYIITW